MTCGIVPFDIGDRQGWVDRGGMPVHRIVPSDLHRVSSGQRANSSLTEDGVHVGRSGGRASEQLLAAAAEQIAKAAIGVDQAVIRETTTIASSAASRMAAFSARCRSSSVYCQARASSVSARA